MEGIGVAGSVVTLLSAATRISRETVELVHSIDDAPAELRQISATIASVPSILEELSSLHNEYIQLIESDSGLRSALSMTEAVLRRIMKACRYRGEDIRFRTRLRWAFLEKNQVSKLLSQLQTAQIALLFSLKPIEM